MKIENPVVLITGANCGIDLAFARALLDPGAGPAHGLCGHRLDAGSLSIWPPCSTTGSPASWTALQRSTM